MNRKILLCALVWCAAAITAQNYTKYNLELIGHIDPDTVQPQNDNQYSGCWGWYQPSKNREYVISGARSGTWFIDVTNPATPSVCAYVPGVSQNCVWREVKTYQNYCYIASDACQPNAFQIVDLQYLPDSVKVIHNDSSLFTLGHTLWVDQDMLYVGTTTFGNGKGYSPMTVWSLDDPENPSLIRRLEKDDNTVSEVHDMYVRNDTVYASAGWQGIRIYELDRADSSFTQIGSYNNYGNIGSYNHSSFLTANGKYLVFCDEVPGGMPIRLVDVQNLQNIQPVAKWHPYTESTPHNPYLLGNKHAVVSSYQDGIFVYDISNPTHPGLTGFFDTYPEGGQNTGNYGTDPYSGNWGAYPYLPSGVLVAQDMRNGVFLLDASIAYTLNVLGNREQPATIHDVAVFPNPVNSQLTVYGAPAGATVVLRDLPGKAVMRMTATTLAQRLDVSDLAAGVYILEVSSGAFTTTKRVAIAR